MKKNILSLLSATMFFGVVFGIFALVNIAERDTVNAKIIEVNENEITFKVTDFNSNQYNHEYVWELEENETFKKILRKSFINIHRSYTCHNGRSLGNK